VSSNTIDGGLPQSNNQGGGILDCSTLSTHSINDLNTAKGGGSSAVSKANLHGNN
jgi:hypothetical protein